MGRGALLVALVGLAARAARAEEAALAWERPPLLEHGVVAFIHLPKTGGTSLIMAMSRWAAARSLVFFHDHNTCDPNFGRTCETTRRLRPRAYGLPTRRWPAVLFGGAPGPPRNSSPPVLFASHGVRYGSVDFARGVPPPPGGGDPAAIARGLFGPAREACYVMIVRDPLDRVVSLLRQFPEGHDVLKWWAGAREKLCGLAWRYLGVPATCDRPPTGADWEIAARRVRDRVLILRTEQSAASARLLDAVAGSASGPTFEVLARERFRCAASDASRDGQPGRRCTAAARNATPVDPRGVVPAAIFPALEVALAPDVALTDHLRRVFDARLRQFGIPPDGGPPPD